MNTCIRTDSAAFLRNLLLPVLVSITGLSGCSSDSAVRLYAQQNEAAQLRQPAESKPAKRDSKGMYLGLIRQMQAQGLYFASLAHIDAYEQQYGSGPEVQRLRADAFRETRQAAAADAAYRNLLTSSEAAAAWHGLGLLAARSGNYAAAVAPLQAAAKREPTNPVMLSDLGYALLRSGDTGAARIPLAQAAELAPDDRKIIANLALLLLVSGDIGRARAVMEQAKLSPDGRATVYRLADEIANGRRAAANAHQSSPDASRPATGERRDSPAVSLPANPFQSMRDRFGSGS